MEWWLCEEPPSRPGRPEDVRTDTGCRTPCAEPCGVQTGAHGKDRKPGAKPGTATCTRSVCALGKKWEVKEDKSLHGLEKVDTLLII